MPQGWVQPQADVARGRQKFGSLLAVAAVVTAASVGSWRGDLQFERPMLTTGMVSRYKDVSHHLSFRILAACISYGIGCRSALGCTSA